MLRRASPTTTRQWLTQRHPQVRNRGEIIAYCTTLILIVADAGLVLYDLGRAITVLA